MDAGLNGAQTLTRLDAFQYDGCVPDCCPPMQEVGFETHFKQAQAKKWSAGR